eukprot:TRINITY_DN52967_c0_g1_i1.p3 TRINITY_DN52967_c0_g1~~TRINITY_DN52967_c0_g1_i1.p3  ORF type:complete len:177 (+),score=27.61 TRINITY_DN52967_c0_g1_i1:58-531(+)
MAAVAARAVPRLAAAALGWHAVYVLCGVALTEQVLSTAATAAAAALCSAGPLLLAGVWDLRGWRRVAVDGAWDHVAEQRAAVVCRSVAAAQWLACAAVPLDWDVWWQRWPLPCLAGIAIGGAAGMTVAVLCTSWTTAERPSRGAASAWSADADRQPQ